MLRNALILSGAGVGGGSLNYANTLYEPPSAPFADPQWSHIPDWNAELSPHYDQAKWMLGVTTNPVTTAADVVLRGVAEDLGVCHTYQPTPVGVLFGSRGVEVDDPYFGGADPRGSGCLNFGACMTRLPAQRQEHADQELPASRRSCRCVAASFAPSGFPDPN